MRLPNIMIALISGLLILCLSACGESDADRREREMDEANARRAAKGKVCQGISKRIHALKNPVHSYIKMSELPGDLQTDIEAAVRDYNCIFSSVKDDR